MVSDYLLSFAVKNYGFNKETLRFVSDSTNQIYAYNLNGEDYILRFSNRPLEKIHETKAEMEWLDYLAKNNIGVGQPLHANNGDLILSTQENGQNFILSSFKVVSGECWDKNDLNKWNDRVFYNWGKCMGDIHRITKNFKPMDVRGTFDGRFALMDSVKSCPSVNDIVEQLINEMMALPKDKDSYGLIHNDMHPWNFYIDKDKINVFDFDDSLYGWFSLDIGIALYHGLWWGRKDDAGTDFTKSIIVNFLDGYLSANNLSEFWISKIPMFMRFRQICKFSWFFNPGYIDEHQQERIQNIENGILFKNCEIDYLF